MIVNYIPPKGHQVVYNAFSTKVQPCLPRKGEEVELETTDGTRMFVVSRTIYRPTSNSALVYLDPPAEPRAEIPLGARMVTSMEIGRILRQYQVSTPKETLNHFAEELLAELVSAGYRITLS